MCGPDGKGDLWWVRPNLPFPCGLLSSCCSPNLSPMHSLQCSGWEMLDKGCHPAVTAKTSAFLSGKKEKNHSVRVLELISLIKMTHSIERSSFKLM